MRLLLETIWSGTIFLVSLAKFLVIPRFINWKNCNKSRLLFSSAEMIKKPLWQTVWTQIRLLQTSLCVLGLFSCFCSRLLTFSKIIFFKSFFQEHYQTTFCWSWSESKLFAKVISRRQRIFRGYTVFFFLLWIQLKGPALLHYSKILYKF